MLSKILCIALCVLLFVQTAHASEHGAVERQFKEWAATWKKSYSVTEYAEKLTVFAKNLDHYKEMSEKTGAVYGPDRFSDLSLEEFQKLYLMEKFDAGEACLFNDSRVIKSVKQVKGTATPSSWDWTAQSPSPVGPVKGTCDHPVYLVFFFILSGIFISFHLRRLPSPLQTRAVAEAAGLSPPSPPWRACGRWPATLSPTSARRSSPTALRAASVALVPATLDAEEACLGK
jgi:hypothetical protein